MEKEELDDKTIVVSRGQIDDATIVVPRESFDDATIVVARDQVDDGTVVVKRQVEDATISFSKPVDENTVTGASGPQTVTNSFEESLPVTPTGTTGAVVVEEEDAELQIEEYVDPEAVIRKTKTQKITTSNINLSEGSVKPVETPKPKSALHDAQKLMNKNKARSASNSKIAVIAVFIGVALIGLTLAVLIK